MLVLSRKQDESIVLTLPTDPAALAALAGTSIEFTVVAHHNNCVRLGIEADRSINIVRKELANATN